METNLAELRKTLSAGVSAEFLNGLPPISSRAAQILFLPLALNVKYSQGGNESRLFVDKLEFAEILGLPPSYKAEGNLNKWVGGEANVLLSLEVCGIKIIKSLSLPRGEIVIEYSSAAMSRFFQNLPRKGQYFAISGDTLSKLKHTHTWQLVKNLLSSYNYSNDTVCTFSRNTMGIKMIFGLEKSDYMRKMVILRAIVSRKMCLHP